MPSRSLEILLADIRVRVFPIEKSVVRIGRAGDNDLVLADAARHVSRWHAVIFDNGDGPVILSDLASANGTFLNGRPIAVSVAVLPNDSIKIGDFRLVLRESM